MRPLRDAAGNRHPCKERDTYLGRKLVLGSLPQEGTSSSGDGPDQPTIIAGSLTVQTDQAVTERYAFDAQNRLKAVTRDDIWLASSLADNFQNFRQADHITVAGYGSTLFKLEQRRYDALGQLLEVEAEEAIANDTIRLIYGLADPNQPKGNAMPGIGDERLRYQYDKLGRMQRQSTWGSDWNFSSTVSYVQADHVSTAVPTPRTPNGYDLAGNVLQYTVFNASGPASTFRMDYVWRDGALLTTTTGYRDKAPRPGVTLKTYDGNGHIRSVIDPNDTKSDITRQFNTDANGTVLRSVQVGQEVPSYLQVDADGKPLPAVHSNAGDLTANEQFQLVAAGQVLGRYGEMVNPDAPRNKDNNLQFIADQDFNFVFKSVNDGAAQGTSTYTVAKGDTLQSIAKAQLGDADLWFTIAQANGLADSAGLEEGQVLRIPAVVVTSTNNDDGTFEAYDPTAVIGDTTPVIPQPPKKKTNWFKQLVIVVVGVVVTIYTGGGALGAFLGALASQTTAIVLGEQKGFDLKQLALAAIGGGITAGLGQVGALSNAGSLGTFGGAATRALISSAVTQGIGVATGLQKEFSWRAVAASALSAGVGEVVGEHIGGVDWQNRLSGSDFFKPSLASNLASSLTRGVVMAQGGKVNVGQVLVDGFGQTLGSSLMQNYRLDSQQEKRLQYTENLRDAEMTRLMSLPGQVQQQPSTYSGGQAWAADLASRRADNLRNMSPTMLAYSLPDPAKTAWNQVQNHPDFPETYGGGSAYIDGLQQSFELEAAQKNLQLMAAVAAARANDPNLSLNRNQLWAAAGSFVGWGQDSAANSFMMRSDPTGFANLAMMDARNNQQSMMGFYLDTDPASIVAKGSNWLTSAIGNQGSERAASIAINVEQLARESIFPRLTGLPSRGDYGDLYAPGVPSIENAILLPNVAANMGRLNGFTGMVSGLVPGLGQYIAANELTQRQQTASTLYDVGLLNRASLNQMTASLSDQRAGLSTDLGLSMIAMGGLPFKVVGGMLVSQDAVAGRATPFGSPQNVLAAEIRALAAAGSGATLRQLASATTMSRYLVGAAGNAPIDLVRAAGFSAETFTQMYAKGVLGLETFMVQRANGTGFDIITAKLGSNGTLSNVMMLDVKNSAGLVDSVTAFGAGAKRASNYTDNLNDAIRRLRLQDANGVQHAYEVAEALRQRQFGIGIVTAPGARISTGAVTQITTATGRSPQLLPWLP